MYLCLHVLWPKKMKAFSDCGGLLYSLEAYYKHLFRFYFFIYIEYVLIFIFFLPLQPWCAVFRVCRDVLFHFLVIFCPNWQRSCQLQLAIQVALISITTFLKHLAFLSSKWTVISNNSYFDNILLQKSIQLYETLFCDIGWSVCLRDCCLLGYAKFLHTN
jgi:hypothetical protein